MSDRGPLLAVRGLTFGYGKKATVRDVSLTVHEGDCYGFLGHNGAGKTTVMRLCLQLLRARAGTILVDGIDARRHPREARARIGALIERPGFHPEVSARDNLALLAQLAGMDKRAARCDADRVLELVSLQRDADRPAGSFSLGMRQRLGIAQSLLGSPRLLLLDEPINGLDPEGVADMRALLLRLSREQGCGVLVSSHQLQELDGLCTRIGVMRDGAMVLEGSLDALKKRIASRTIVESVEGASIDAMAQRLASLGLAPQREGERLLVNLGERAAGDVARELAKDGTLSAFYPEPVSLESIYLRATKANEPVVAVAEIATALPSRAPERVRAPLLRALGHEVRTMLLRRKVAALLAVPVILAALRAWSYVERVASSQARVASKELFSADAGSGHRMFAEAMTGAVPALALCLAWLGSQSLAADLQRDTLRNTLSRSVQRCDALFGKLFALFATAIAGFSFVIVASGSCAIAMFGWNDLEEVTRNGDRQTLAYAADVAPAMGEALLATLPSLLAVSSLALCASCLTPRPSRALALSLVLLLGPELVHSFWPATRPYLLTSHLPTPLRDDSALSWLASLARGAADANWVYEATAFSCPALWIAVSCALSLIAIARLRIP